MKKILLILAGVLILCSGIVYHYNSDPGSIIARLALKDGAAFDTLEYRINLFGFIPVGEAVLKIYNPQEGASLKAYHLNAIAKSLNYIAFIFNGEATLDSYVDTENFTSLVFRQKIVILNKADISKEIIYDQKNAVMQINGEKRQIFPNTYDPLSAAFNFMRMDFSQVKDLEINLNSNQKNYILNGTVIRNHIKINNSIHSLISLNAQISRRDKNPYHKSNVRIVFLEGQENIPLCIRVFASGFLINACLVDIK